MLPLTITIKENLRLKDVPPEFMELLVEKLQFINPKWLENERMGRWNRGTPKLLKYYDKVGITGLWVPRGYIRHLINMCRRQEIKFQCIKATARATHLVLHAVLRWASILCLVVSGKDQIFRPAIIAHRG